MAIVQISSGDTINQGRTKINSAFDEIVTGATATNSTTITFTKQGGGTFTVDFGKQSNVILESQSVYTYVSGLTFNISGTQYVVNGSYVVSNGTTVTLSSGPVSGYRYDVVVGDDTGTISVVSGSDASVPQLPVLTSTQTPLLVIKVGTLASTISQLDIFVPTWDLNGGSKYFNYAPFGKNVSSGATNILLGAGAYADGNNNVIIGGKNVAVKGANNSIIFAKENYTGTTSDVFVVDGKNTYLRQSASIGVNNTVSDSYCLGVGAGNTVTDQNSAVIGDSNDNDAAQTLVIGSSCVATPGHDNSLLVGGPIQSKSANTVHIQHLAVQSGASDSSFGSVKLAAGTATVNTTRARNDKMFFLSHNFAKGGNAANVGHIYVSSITNDASFVITSSNGSDDGVVDWWIVDSIG